MDLPTTSGEGIAAVASGVLYLTTEQHPKYGYMLTETSWQWNQRSEEEDSYQGA